MNILSIGNSFSVDATQYLHDMAAAAGEDINTENMYIGGCSLETHASNFKTESKAYELFSNGVSANEFVSIQDMLSQNKWDIITLQQASHLSIDFSTYNPYLDELANGVKKACPDSEIVIHQTWAYEDGSERLAKTVNSSSSRKMYLALKDAYNRAASLIGAKQIPCGLAFNLACEKNFAPLHRDTFHAQIPQGRYLLSAVWFEFFTGKNASQSSFIADGMSKDDKIFLDKIAHEAICINASN